MSEDNYQNPHRATDEQPSVDKAIEIAARQGEVVLFPAQGPPKLRDLPKCPPEVHPSVNLMVTCMRDIEANMIEGKHRSVSRACRETGWSRDTWYSASRSSDVVRLLLEEHRAARRVAARMIGDRLVPMVDKQISIARDGVGRDSTNAFKALMALDERIAESEQSLLELEEIETRTESPAAALARKFLEREADTKTKTKVTIESEPVDPLDKAIDANP